MTDIKIDMLKMVKQCCDPVIEYIVDIFNREENKEILSKCHTQLIMSISSTLLVSLASTWARILATDEEHHKHLFLTMIDEVHKQATMFSFVSPTNNREVH